MALGLLINLVSGVPGNSRLLTQLAAGGGSAGSGSVGSDQAIPGASSALVPLLCSIMAAVAALQQQQQLSNCDQSGTVDNSNTAAGGRQQQEQQLLRDVAPASSPPSATATDTADAAGEASIVEVYCGVLLGFLVRDCPSLGPSVASSLGDSGLDLVVNAVRRCLHFYVSAGAITDHTRGTLQELLAQLEGGSTG